MIRFESDDTQPKAARPSRPSSATPDKPADMPKPAKVSTRKRPASTKAANPSTTATESGFDRKAYQRDLMRKRRAKAA